METYLSAYLICLALLVVIITGIAIRAFINWQTPGARTLGALMLSMAVWAGFYFLEIVHPSIQAKIFARRMLYLGMTLSPPLWLAFALRYTGIGAWWLMNGRIFLLAIPGAVAFLLGSTNDLHHLVWTSLTSTGVYFAPLDAEYGIGFWIYFTLAYTMVATGIIVYFISYLKAEKALRVRTGIVLAGVILTTIVNAVFIYFENGISLDPTPLFLGFSAPLIALGFFRFGVPSLFPLAAAIVIENLQDAIIVVNREGEVVNLNPAAGRLLGMNTFWFGKTALSILPQAEKFNKIWDSPESNIDVELKSGGTTKWYDARVIPIQKKGDGLLGRVVVLHDITNEQAHLRAEERRSRQLALLEEAGRRIADSFDEREILQRAVETVTRQFGYAETAISLLTADNMLEIAAISGAEDFGYRPGYRQKLGEGIIGYTAGLQKTYVSGNVSEDSHYYSTSTKSGSAICTPIFQKGALYGVFYAESLELNAFGELDILTLETLASQISESLHRAALYAQTQSDLRTLTAIQEISKLVASSLDLETISRTVVKSLKEAFGYTHVSIYFLNDDYLNLSAQVGYPENMVIKKIHISQGVAGRTIRTKSVQFIEDAEKEDTFLKADTNITSEICVPLIKDDNVLGVLNVESGEETRLKEADVKLLATIAGPIAVSVDNARLHAEIKKMATTDAVTGLANRHIFEQAINAEVERAERKGTQLSLIVFDIDFFKEYNDKWGHPAGDARLRAVANLIKLNLRKYDIAARYGGDEFAIILSECDQPSAVQFAQRLRNGIQEGAPHPPTDGEGVSGYTLSMGIATFPLDAILPAELLIAADHAAMRAKQQGRNRVKLASDYESA